MPENLFATYLDVDSDVLNPDYYQLLLLNPENVADSQVEEQFKLQIS